MHLVAISPGEIKRVVLLEVLAGKNGVNGILDVWIKYKDRRFILVVTDWNEHFLRSGKNE